MKKGRKGKKRKLFFEKGIQTGREVETDKTKAEEQI